MFYTPTSTTYVSSSRQHSNSLHVIARGPAPPPMSSIPYPYHGLHNMPSLPSPGYDHTASWDRSQQPPPLNHNLSPYGNIPLPPLSSEGVELNPVLEYTPVSMVDWDVTCPSSNAVMDYRRRSARGHTLDEPATRPSFTSMTIRTPFSSRPIVVHHPYGAVITIRDVLASVHAHLCACASEPASPGPIAGLLEAHQQFDVASDTQIQYMVARLLGRKTRWAGLSPSSSEPDVWHLHLK